MGIIAKYARLVKFSHTVFALPFALVGFVYGLETHIGPHSGPLFGPCFGTCFGTLSGAWWWLRILVLVVLCMVFARNAAMAFNRWADAPFDAANPRTSGREIPAGLITPRAALLFVIVNAVLFVGAAACINPLALALSPVALLVLLGYSYTKRFTAWSHIVLGMALAIAPVGAYIAVTGSVAMAPVLLAALVLTWVAGFDILYARADAEFDRRHGLHSVPARWPGWKSHAISILLHLVTIYAVVLFGLFTSCGTAYWIGAGIFVALLVLQHTSRRLPFDWVNGAASVAFAGLAIVDFLI